MPLAGGHPGKGRAVAEPRSPSQACQPNRANTDVATRREQQRGALPGCCWRHTQSGTIPEDTAPISIDPSLRTHLAWRLWRRRVDRLSSVTDRRAPPTPTSRVDAMLACYRKLLLLPAIAVLPFLGGCVGMSIIHPGKVGPVNEPSPNCRLAGSPCWDGGIDSCSALIDSWGKPDKISISGAQRRLTYSRGRTWAGIRPVALIPLRLAVPVGHKTITFTCDGDGLIEASGVTTKTTGFHCGLITREGLLTCHST